MSNNPGTLSDEDVRQITLLVETLDRSTFDFLQVELGDLKVTLGKGVPPDASAAPAATPTVQFPAPASRGAPASVAPPAAAGVPATAAPPAAAAGSTGTHAQNDTVTVVAPMLGRFYSCPEPGAPPFVSVGAEVGPDSTVALIEVMKMFTAVRAGMRGVVAEVCVQNEQFVEYGQVLLRVRPAG